MSPVILALYLVALILIVTGIRRWFPAPRAGEAFYKNRPLLFGHRGLLRVAPENSLASYLAAVEAGFTAIEMDVVHTRDRALVCSHNFDLERETDGCGYFNDHNWTDLKKVRNGIHSHPSNTTRLIRLEDALARLPQSLLVNIEIKSHRITNIRHALAVARLIKKNQLQNRVFVSSFNPFVVWVVRLIDRKIFTGLILETMDYFWAIRLVRPDFLHPDAELVTPKLMDFCRRKRLRVNVWTVNTYPAIAWLIGQGVDGIFTDIPQAATWIRNSL